MLPTPPVPAVPASLDPLLMPRGGRGPHLLGTPASEMRVLVLGLDPITSAAAVLLAGCGVRGFTVVDDGPVTWADARAGAFDATEVGRSRDLCTRHRIRAANAEAAPVTWTDDVLSDDRPGRAILRTCRAHARADGGTAVEAAGDHLPLPGGAALVEVTALPASRAALLSPTRPWRRRPCPGCREAAVLEATAQRRRGPGAGAGSLRAAGPAHTAFCAALVAEAVLAAAAGARSDAEDEDARLLRPGPPWSTCTPIAPSAEACPLCGP